MQKITPAANPNAYGAALHGWQRDCVEEMRAAVGGAATFEEKIKWGHLFYFYHGPAVLIRAEAKRVLLGFWRGQRLLSIDARLKPSGKYEMATLNIVEGMIIDREIVRRLAFDAADLNRTLGDPTKSSR